MKVAIVGSRTVTPSMEDFDRIGITRADTVVTGGARGVDKAAEKWAKEKNIDLDIFYPRYDIYGRAAPR